MYILGPLEIPFVFLSVKLVKRSQGEGGVSSEVKEVVLKTCYKKGLFLDSGQIEPKDVFAALKPVEERILSKGHNL